MKALTVCQPYADLLLLPDSDPKMKRCENRTWKTSHVGRLAIHAGINKSYLIPGDNTRYMVFGAVLGTVELVDCVADEDLPQWVLRHMQYEFLLTHKHVEGPYCWIVRDPIRFQNPIKCKGALGLWEWRPA